jgi:RNA recognition motif-containing protein
MAQQPSPDRSEPGDGTAMDIEDVRTRNVYVGDLPLTFDKEHLSAMMQQFGPVETTRIFNESTKVSSSGKAYGFCLFAHAADAAHAVAGIDGLVIEGRPVQVRLSDNGVVKIPVAKQRRAKQRAARQLQRKSDDAEPRTTSSAPSADHTFASSEPSSPVDQGLPVKASATTTPVNHPPFTHSRPTLKLQTDAARFNHGAHVNHPSPPAHPSAAGLSPFAFTPTRTPWSSGASSPIGLGASAATAFQSAPTPPHSY